jgi:hypothetical protein
MIAEQEARKEQETRKEQEKRQEQRREDLKRLNAGLQEASKQASKTTNEHQMRRTLSRRIGCKKN